MIQRVIAFSATSEYALGTMPMITTARLRLVPTTANLTQLEIDDLPQFFRYLDVEPIADWPSDNLANVLPFFRDQLSSDPSLVGWLAWYWILDTPEGALLVGGGGFKGRPANGEVKIGYETRVPYRRTGIASEAVSAHVIWALNHPSVTHVTAEVHVDNVASIRVLMKLAFDHIGDGSENNLLRFERTSDDL